MASYNKVILIGNLTKDPELRYTPGSAAVCEFAIAVNRQWTSKAGEKKEEVTYVDIIVWARQAETCAEYLKKGSLTCIEGRLTLDRWQDRNSGQARSRMRVTAERVQFLSYRQDGAGALPDQPAEAMPADDGGDIPF